MYELFARITKYCGQNTLLRKNSTIIIGLSGGPDSVLLLHYLYAIKDQYNLKLIAAHLDHEWRPTSNEDMLFCKKLCENLAIEFIAKKASELPDVKYEGSKEAQARTMRRLFFKEIAAAYKADAVALAHHEQDQQETFFIRLIRGATLSGLIGMRPKSYLYIRPLLATPKAEILTYLTEHKISYLEDPTNTSMDFLRNRIRMTVLPALEECDQRFNANFTRTLQSLTDTENYIDQLMQTTYATCTHRDAHNLTWLSLEKFFALDPFMQRRIIMHWLISHAIPFTPSEGIIKEIVRFFCNTKSNTHLLYNQWKIIKKRGAVRIHPV